MKSYLLYQTTLVADKVIHDEGIPIHGQQSVYSNCEDVRM